MLKNKQKNERKFVAVPWNHKTNIENHKPYEIYKDIKSNYRIVMEQHVDGYKLHEAIVKKFNQKCKTINIDIDSFVRIVKNKKQIQKLFMTLSGAFHYVSVVPFTMKKELPKTIKFDFVGKKLPKYKKLLAELAVVSTAQTFARKLQDMPSNLMYPETFVKEVQEFLSSTKVKVTVLEKNELEAKKMGAILGVGQAAKDKAMTPRIMVLEYLANPDDKSKKAYVGKGVCFDAGGYNIKTGINMRWMKYDMSGAAIVAGTIYALAKNNIKTNVVAVCPLVVNFVNEIAQRPDDIITSYIGKTIEIDNTDAEGRLILADALTYAAKDLGATEIYDIATLTGAMVFSLGDTYTGTWATNDDIWGRVLESAEQAGEQVWRLPFHDDFLKMLKSNVADIVNSCNGPAAGSSRAACFLKEFTLNKPYVHFDVAATADKNNTGTGILLKTLYNLAKI